MEEQLALNDYLVGIAVTAITVVIFLIIPQSYIGCDHKDKK